MASEEELTSIFQGIRQSADPSNNPFFSAHDQTTVLNMFRVFIFVMEKCGYDHSINPCVEEDMKVHLFYLKVRILFKYFYPEADNPREDWPQAIHDMWVEAHPVPGFLDFKLGVKAEDFHGSYTSMEKPLSGIFKDIKSEDDLLNVLVERVTMMGQGNLKRGVDAFIENEHKL